MPQLLDIAMEIPWGQKMLIIHQIKDSEERKYYLRATEQLGWSRAVLLNQIKCVIIFLTIE
jgi:predicted nuclease of restriction endonuclease-like (RecB) superfamily